MAPQPCSDTCPPHLLLAPHSLVGSSRGTPGPQRTRQGPSSGHQPCPWCPRQHCGARSPSLCPVPPPSRTHFLAELESAPHVGDPKAYTQAENSLEPHAYTLSHTHHSVPPPSEALPPPQAAPPPGHPAARPSPPRPPPGPSASPLQPPTPATLLLVMRAACTLLPGDHPWTALLAPHPALLTRSPVHQA